MQPPLTRRRQRSLEATFFIPPGYDFLRPGRLKPRSGGSNLGYHPGDVRVTLDAAQPHHGLAIARNDDVFTRLSLYYQLREPGLGGANVDDDRQVVAFPCRREMRRTIDRWLSAAFGLVKAWSSEFRWSSGERVPVTVHSSPIAQAPFTAGFGPGRAGARRRLVWRSRSAMKAAAPTGRQITIEGVVVVAENRPCPAIAALHRVVGNIGNDETRHAGHGSNQAPNETLRQLSALSP